MGLAEAETVCINTKRDDALNMNPYNNKNTRTPRLTDGGVLGWRGARAATAIAPAHRGAAATPERGRAGVRGRGGAWPAGRAARRGSRRRDKRSPHHRESVSRRGRPWCLPAPGVRGPRRAVMLAEGMWKPC